MSVGSSYPRAATACTSVASRPRATNATPPSTSPAVAVTSVMGETAGGMKAASRMVAGHTNDGLAGLATWTGMRHDQTLTLRTVAVRRATRHTTPGRRITRGIVPHTPHTDQSICTHDRRPGTTVCLHCRHAALEAA